MKKNNSFLFILKDKLPVYLLFLCNQVLAQSGIYLQDKYSYDSLILHPKTQEKVHFQSTVSSNSTENAFQPRIPGIFGDFMIQSPLFKSNGRLMMHNHWANIQNPYSRSELMYSRLSFNGNIFLMGLPFQVNSFLTTENNSSYNSSFFRISFDSKTYRQQLENKLQAELKSLQKQDRFKQLILDQLLEAQKKLDKEVLEAETWKTRGKDSLSRLKTVSLPGKYKDSLSSHRNVRNPADTLKLPGKPSFPADSIHNHKLDSLKQVKDSVHLHILSIYEKLQQDSIRIQQIKSILEGDPGSVLKDSAASLAGNRMNWISRVEKLQVGQAIVNYDELSLWGLPLRGLDITLTRNRWAFSATSGRALDMQTPFVSENKPLFDKNLAGFRVGRRFVNNDHITLSCFYSIDSRKNEQKERNAVTSLSWSRTLGNIQFAGNAAHSEYSILYPVSFQASPETTLNPWLNKALQSKLGWTGKHGTQLYLKYHYIGGNYTSIGNVFLRKNYQEKEAGWDQKWWKKKISTGIFYKELLTLRSELSPEVNRVKGYGAKIQSSFSKGMNFYAVYTPYEQGNNHPDTAFRTFNRSNMFIAGLTYMKTWKRVIWFSQASYTHSDIYGDNLPTTVTRSYSLENQLEINGYQQFRIECNWNRTIPNLDSVSFKNITLSYTRVIKQNVKIGLGARKTDYGSSQGLMGVSFSCDYLVKKKYLLKAYYANDRVHNWWGIEGTRHAQSVNISFGYQW